MLAWTYDSLGLRGGVACSSIIEACKVSRVREVSEVSGVREVREVREVSGVREVREVGGQNGRPLGLPHSLVSPFPLVLKWCGAVCARCESEGRASEV